jgi:hypothetical protein
MVSLLVTGHCRQAAWRRFTRSLVALFQVGLERKAKEFKESGAEIYAKT